MKRWLVIILAMAFVLPSMAQEPLVFASEAEQARFDELTRELRCLVCQNQSLADSDAPLAHDLRNEVFNMMRVGHSDEEIRRFLIDRYGDFVLYRPPVKGNTLVLWLAPALLLLAGVTALGFSVSKRRALLREEDEAESA